jgi:hypothetical protein
MLFCANCGYSNVECLNKPSVYYIVVNGEIVSHFTSFKARLIKQGELFYCEHCYDFKRRVHRYDCYTGVLNGNRLP